MNLGDVHQWVAALAIAEALIIGLLLLAMSYERKTSLIWLDRWQAERDAHAHTVSHCEKNHVVREDHSPKERDIDEAEYRMEKMFGFKPGDPI